MKVLFITDAADRAETELLAQISEHADVTFMTNNKGRYTHILQSTGAKFLYIDIQKRFDIEAIKKIKSAIEQDSYDIIQAFTSRSITCAIQAGKRGSMKILGYRGVVTNNSYLQIENWFSYLHPRLDGIFCVSEAVRQSFLRKSILKKITLGKKLKTIHKGHNPQWYQGKAADLTEFGVPSNVPTLCCLSRNSVKKGILTLLDAFDDLPSEKNAHLLLVGSINKNKKAISRVQRCKHPERIFFTGYTNNPAAIIRASTLLVSASKNEGLPRVVLEAMCVQCPVVATSVGGTVEVITDGENGLIVAPGNKNQLTESILEVLNNPYAAKKRANLALQTIYKKFHTTESIKNTLAWYRSMVSK